jgi:predicted 3-demethylubiquinone-9 3-methyltransferase (glyoxalase superfamily)
MAKTQKISTSLWFDGNAEEAINFYISVFDNSRITDVMYYGDAAPLPKGTVLSITFELDGQEFIAINGGPMFKFTEAISLFVKCETQAEVDRYWNKLTADGGKPVQCGWLKDKYGLSWQIVPVVLGTMLRSSDPAKANRVMQAMMKMVKLDIAGLQQAYNQAA